jgi:hypothetical protein
VNEVIAALAGHFIAGQMPERDKLLNRALKASLSLASLPHQRGHSRPAMPLVIRTIGKRDQDELFARLQVDGPRRCHDANAH